MASNQKSIWNIKLTSALHINIKLNNFEVHLKTKQHQSHCDAREGVRGSQNLVSIILWITSVFAQYFIIHLTEAEQFGPK